MIEEEDWAPDVDMIRSRITNRTKAIVVINPNNPTGAVYREKDLREIGNIAAEYDIPVISDEIYDKIVFDGESIPCPAFPTTYPELSSTGSPRST